MSDIKVIKEKSILPSTTAKQKTRTSSPNSIIFAGIIALFIVTFLWGFWYQGISVFGFNISVLWLLILGLFFQNRKDAQKEIYINLYWIVPLMGIIFAFSMYENPFLKSINIILLPITTLFFFNYARSSIDGNQRWTLGFLRKIASRKITLGEGRKSIIQSVEHGRGNAAILQKIGIGVAILFGLNIIIISLLATADSNFAKIVETFLDIFNFSSVIRLIFGIFLLFLFTALKLSWDDTLIVSNREKEKQRDTIIAGIIIGGTLITYLIFIGVQFQTIISNPVPLNSLESVIVLAKNGFWQLFFVSIINVLFFFVYYKKTNDSVQNILLVFVIASLIILLSAGNKMFTYIYHYGLSYEKFFASYTVIYFGILFCIMLYFVLSKKSLDILKTSLVIALYMYSFANILPTERFIFNINTSISERPHPHISPYQSHMLSIDILDDVEKMKGTTLYRTQSWKEWTEKKLKNSANKKWYEKNLSDF